jgi:hypothetical protein
MKNVVTILIMLSGASMANAQFTLDHYHPLEIIKKLEIDSCSVYSVTGDSSLTIEQTYVYNTDGKEVEYRRDDQNFSYIYHYNTDGVLVSIWNMPLDRKTWERDTLIYDKKGKLLKSITYTHEGIESTRNEYKYKKKKLVEERYILYGNLHVKSIYKYDRKRKTKTVSRNFRGQPQGDWLYQLDSEGKILSFSMLNPDGQVLSIQNFKYNSEGLEIEQVILDREGVISQMYTTIYDSRGLIDYTESWTGIENGKLEDATYVKTVYKYR